jgi:glycerophosphoryl diester phosphodiesterase
MPARRPVLAEWRTLAIVDVVYKAIAFAVLTPLIIGLLRLLIRRTGTTAITDADIALFFFTTRTGTIALLLVGALAAGVTALEQACLMTVVLAAMRGQRLRVRDAFAHGGARAFAIVRLGVHIVVRLLAIAAPFAAALGATYWGLLRAHDINYYLADRPPSAWAAAAIVVVTAALLAIVLASKALSWMLTLPLVVFENVLPVRAFAESARRMDGRRRTAAGVLGAWAAASAALPVVASWVLEGTGRALAPGFGRSLPSLLAFVTMLAITWGAVSLVIGVATAVVFASIVMRTYFRTDGAAAARMPASVLDAPAAFGLPSFVSWRTVALMVAGTVILGTGGAYLLLRDAWTDRPVLVLAHRGASIEAPENTLAAFRRAGELRADFVELDVQESSDGVVVVVHDSDLMKVGRSPLKIWEATAAQLRAVDIGSHLDPRFRDERVPTLAEVLEACNGVLHVDIELKSYGHDVKLEERVAELVEAAGMEREIVTMSLDRGMVAKMKRLRPAWTSGLLSAKAMGDLSGVPADFLAVEKAMATRRFIRNAHRAGKPVYVWTVDDAAQMIRAIGRGADGLITNRPDLAREVLDRYARMPEAERLLTFVMTTLGANPDVTPPDSELRP